MLYSLVSLNCQVLQMTSGLERYMLLVLQGLMQTVLARDAFIRTYRPAIAMMFVRLSVWDGRALCSYDAL